MTESEIREHFSEVLDDIERRSCVTDHFVDRDVYRLYLATLWANVVLNPADAGLTEADLESLHDYLNRRIAGVLGESASVTECFRFINSKAGEQAMKEARLNQTHKELLLYFSSMILDPDGHRRWMSTVLDNDPRL
ncbi:MAG: hypothetical protein PVH91_12030 [Pseudomonadales bacterium]|jgi:hypothetical protein